MSGHNPQPGSALSPIDTTLPTDGTALRQALLETANDRLILTGKLETIQRTIDNRKADLLTAPARERPQLRDDLTANGKAKNRIQAAISALATRERILTLQERESRRASEERQFIDAARAALPRETYEAIWAVVRPDAVDGSPYREG